MTDTLITLGRWLLAAGAGYWMFTGSVIPVIIMWALLFLNTEMERSRS